MHFNEFLMQMFILLKGPAYVILSDLHVVDWRLQFNFESCIVKDDQIINIFQTENVEPLLLLKLLCKLLYKN